MPYNATSPEEVAMSLGTMRIAVPALTLLYQEEGPGGDGEKHYASVPSSTNYQEVLDDARQCFEEVLPVGLDYRFELKHEISKGCWASIHPRVFADLINRSQIGVFMLSARLARSRGAQNNNAARDIPTTEPPPYATAVAVPERPSARVIGTPGLPIVNTEHAAVCDRCDKEISGVRYRCTVCNDFDYCAICITVAPLEHGHRFDAIINVTTRVYRPMDEWRVTGTNPPPNTYHGGDSWDVRCDICGMYPLVGTRYKCAECPDWDTCQNCLEKASKHHPNHTFIRATDSSVLVKASRRIGPNPRHMRTGYQCNRCSTEIFGSVVYRCDNNTCPVLWVCDTCEALPFSRRQLGLCQHHLTKVCL
ncbi:unnamed protein product [Rhizoctonia solani]|uniref:ZZ-type domain-containing protein n=1 Tax=Rhizoctonia solani TaxID=456999 RepID=A0A8H3BD95_9AGAM|nr:unnamed protein product [Rhizoctonia solani]